LTIRGFERYNLEVINSGGFKVKNYIDIALIITSISLIISVILQNKGVGLGGLAGNDTGGVFTQRRGIEKTLFWITIVLSGLFFVLTMTAVLIS
jgi:preprotein translocase subunit SecG